MSDKKSFVMYISWDDAISLMSDAQAGQLLKTIYSFEKGVEEELEDESIKFVWALIKRKLQEDAEAYQDTVQKRKTSADKRWNAKNASASNEDAKNASASNEDAKNASASKKMQMDGEYDNEYVSVYDSDNDNVSSNEDNINTFASSSLQNSPPLADVAAIPLNDGTEYKATQALVAEYVRLYPNVDVKQQFNEMRAWSLSHEANRKTRRGVKTFINGWLSREQDKGGKTAKKQNKPPQYVDAEPDIYTNPFAD